MLLCTITTLPLSYDDGGCQTAHLGSSTTACAPEDVPRCASYGPALHGTEVSLAASSSGPPKPTCEAGDADSLKSPLGCQDDARNTRPESDACTFMQLRDIVTATSSGTAGASLSPYMIRFDEAKRNNDEEGS